MKQLLANLFEMSEKSRLENEKANKEAKDKIQLSEQKENLEK